MSSENDHEKRIKELESMLAHLQHDYDSLNSVVIALQKELKEINSRIDQLDGRVTILAEGPEVRNLEEEKPPHY